MTGTGLNAVYLITILGLKCSNLVTSFNVDTELSQVIQGPSNSYFGYSVGLLTVNGQARIIVGSPKANSTAHVDWTEPGNIYACPLTHSARCEAIHMGETGDEVPEGMNHQFLGSSLDIWSDKSGTFHRILTCAPLWRNTEYQAVYLVQGRCHEVGYNGDVTFQQIYQPLESRTSLDVGEQVTSDNVYLKGMGQAGIAAEFFKDQSGLLVGAPGLYNWRGGVAFIKNNSRPHYRSYWLDDDFAGDQYTGYSVASGVFFSDETTYSVAGVPRWRGLGKVIIFEGSFNRIKTERQGDQFGEYFGASLCVTNFNGDTYDDLLVGAPLFSDTLEEGRVYAYVSRGLSMITLNQVLRGPRKPRARFGSSIMGIGDSNKDGYNDVAVGAPFTDGMRGAVYVYLGSLSGLSPDYSQEILARQVDPGLRGFGWSLSKPLDTDNNNYQDFAVGAFMSDQVVLLKTRPVAKVHASLHFERDVINLMERKCHYKGQPHACIPLELTFLYTGQYVPDDIEIEYELLSDTNPDDEYEVGRAQISRNYGEVSSVVYERLPLIVGTEMRLHYTVIIKPKLDKFTDVVFELRFNKTQFCSQHLDKSRCPLLDTNEPHTLRHSLSFRKECHSSRGCISDLKVQSTQPKSLLVGGTSFMTIKVIVTNRGEAAYLAMVTIRCQGDIKVAAVDTIEVPRDNPERIKDIRCSSSRSVATDKDLSKTVLACNVGNPLRTGNSVVFLVKFDVRGIEPLGRFTTLELEATTKSTEMNVTLYDNYQSLNIPLKRDVHLDISGVSHPEQLTYRKERTKHELAESSPRLLHLDHVYRIVNIGESIAPDLVIDISVPVSTKDGRPFYQISSIEILPGNPSSKYVSGECLTNHLPPFHTLNSTNHSIGHEAHQPQGSRKFKDVYMNCSQAICVMVPCRLSRLKPGDEAVLTIYGRIYEMSILDIQAYGIIKLSTNATILAEDNSISSKASFRKTAVVVTTEIYPQVLGRSRVNEWLFSVCASGVLIILMFICLALWKIGFFRRAKQEELQKLISVVESTQSDSGRGTNSTSTFNEAGIPEDVSSAAGNTDSEPPESPRYPDDIDLDTLTRSTKRETNNFIFDRPDRAFSNMTYVEATHFGTRV